MVAVLVLLLGLELVCLGLLALLRFRAAGSVLLCVQLQRLLVVLGVALTCLRRERGRGIDRASHRAPHRGLHRAPQSLASGGADRVHG